MGSGTTRWRQTKRGKLWADKVVKLQPRIIFLSGIRSLQATDPDMVPMYHRIVVEQLLRDWELDEMRSGGTGHHIAFVTNGKPYEEDDIP